MKLKKLSAAFLVLVLGLSSMAVGTFAGNVDSGGKLICPLEEGEGHKHTKECFCIGGELICGLEEGEGHIHTDSCYEEEERLICGLEDDEEHTHTDECYTTVKVLTCDIEESEGHVHSDECYCKGGELICGLEESEGHTHTEECYEAEDESNEEEGEENEIANGEEEITENGITPYSDGAVATIEGSDVEYGTLQEALEAVGENGIVYMHSDVTESVSTDGKSYTLDMNNCKLTAAEGETSTGIYIKNGTVTIKNGTVTGATASGIRAVGETTELTLENVTVEKNTASLNNEGTEGKTWVLAGGGVYFVNAAKIELNNCKIRDNAASETEKYRNTRGGGIYSESVKELIINNTEITDNKSVQGGGLLAVYVEKLTMTGSTVSGNRTEERGTGLFLWSTNANLNNSHIDKNIGSYQTNGAAVYATGDGQLYADGCTFNENYLDADVSDIISTSNVICMQSYTNNNDDPYHYFNNCQISGNNNVGMIVNIESDKVCFFRSVIENNSALRCGGINVDGSDWYNNGYDWDYEVQAYIASTVIKNNTAEPIDSDGYIDEASGGISVYDGGHVTLASGAIYDNKVIGTDTNANDWAISCNYYADVADNIHASQMKDGDKDFTNYVWMDMYNTVKVDDESNISGLTWKWDGPTYYLTAMEYVERDVAEIGGTEYMTLSDAVANAQNNDTIVLVAGENDEYGTTIAESPITVDNMSITINMNERTVKAINTGAALFTVGGNGGLKLTGNGIINGEIVNNGELTVDGRVEQLDVTLGKGKYITAGKNIDTDTINITLDSDTLRTVNSTGRDEIEDITIIKDCTDEGLMEKINILGCENPLMYLAVSNGNIVLKKDKTEGIYLDGKNGSDTNDGSYENPVKTFEKAKDLLEKGGYDKIYVLGTVTVSVEEEWSLGEGKTIYRYPTYFGNLVEIDGGKLTLSDIVMDGSSDRGINNASSLIHVKNGDLIINDGTKLQNNGVSESEYTESWGGALRIDGNGNAVMNKGTIQNCNALLGGAVYNSGKFTMEGGTIDSNKAVSGRYTGSGGGVMVAYDGLMTMNGGVIKNNTSDMDGGGISLGGVLTAFFEASNPKLELNGGTITNNKAENNGGGIFVQENCEAVINKNHTGKIFITNNTASGFHNGHFGGGGIYVNGGKDTGYTNGIAYLYNVKISDNTAVKEGGGVAGCVTSNVRVYLTDGGVIYDNDAENARDIRTSLINMAGTPEPTGIGPEKFISEYMLGGGEYHWKDKENKEVESYLLSSRDPVSLHTDLKDGNADIERANDMAEVFITGNTSGTRGGGIGSNGDVVIGSPEGGALKVTKTVSGSKADKDEEFKFKVELDNKSIDGTYNDMEFKDGVAEFTLKHGESKVAIGLPDGVKYTVEETDSKGYTVTYEGDTGTIEDNKVAEAIFDNYKGGGGGHDDKPEPATVYLKAKKLLDGVPAKGDDYEFVLKDENGKVVQRVNNDGQSITFDRLSFDKTGTYTYTVSESVTGDGNIIFDTTVYKAEIKVTKSGNDYKASVTLYKDGVKLSSGDSMVFKNKTNNGDTESLKVNKVWKDDSDKNGKRPNSVKVQLYRDGEKYEEPIELNEDNGWSYLWNKLEKGHTWTVEEIDLPDGYKSSVSSDGLTFTITNTFDKPDNPDDPEDPENPEEPDEPDNPDTPDTPDKPKNPDDYNLGDDGIPLSTMYGDPEPLDDTPKTGDTSNIVLWSGIMILSALGIMLILCARKAKRR